jgi:F-type H+-transporting ATPase subunit delta
VVVAIGLCLLPASLMAFRAANRYARALADVAGETSDYRRALEDLEAFGEVYRDSTDLQQLFEAPGVAAIDKQRVLDQVLHRLGTSLVVSNLLRVLVKNHRMIYLQDVSRAFRRVANQRLGIVEIKIVSATELATPEREALKTRFQELTGKDVEMEFQLDPDLVGGVRAQVGSTVYDGSVRGALDRFKEQLTVV